jgi:type I restriction enzyme, S subunit
MSEWVESPLRDLVSFKKGKKVETSGLPVDGFMPYLGASSLTGGEDGFASPYGGIECVADDALMLWDGERSGLVGPGKEGIISSTVMRLRPKGTVGGRYLLQALRGRFEWIQARRTGTGVPHVPKDLGRILEVNYPKLADDQSVICDILDCVDSQIEATEALIAKQERMRSGLLQDLFTRGIDENGALRPLREEAPHLYYETKLGWLPKGWEVGSLSNKGNSGYLKTGPFGSALKGEHWVAQGHPVITIGALTDSGIDENELLFVSDFTAIRLAAYRLLQGDIVFSRVADVGRSLVVEKDQSGWIMSSNLMRIRLDPSKIRPHFLSLQFSFDTTLRAQIRRNVNTGGRDLANAMILNSLKFFWPNTIEQDRILSRAFAARALIESRRALLKKLLRVKSGLMQDLLTGRVPIDALLESEPA